MNPSCLCLRGKFRTFNRRNIWSNTHSEHTDKNQQHRDEDKKQKTYNSGDSLVVTHLTTNPPVHCLYMAERTGSLVLSVLWSYVIDISWRLINIPCIVSRRPKGELWSNVSTNIHLLYRDFPGLIHTAFSVLAFIFLYMSDYHFSSSGCLLSRSYIGSLF